MWDQETLSMDHEAVYANMKSEMLSATMAFMSQKCDEKGRLLERNIDRETRDGLRSLSERQETGGARVQVTDKSGRHLVDTTANYVASIQPHVENDPVITLKDRDKTERVLNGHSIQMTQILRTGENHGHEVRVWSAVTNHDGHVPVLYGMPKELVSLSRSDPWRGLTKLKYVRTSSSMCSTSRSP